MAFKDAINQEIAKQIASGITITKDLKIDQGILHLGINYEEFYSSGNYATPLTINCVIAVVISLISLYLLTMFKKIFNNLIKEDNPFSDLIMQGLKMCFIIITIILALLTGIGTGVIGGLFFWCIYSIFEYGKILQIEVDETL